MTKKPCVKLEKEGILTRMNMERLFAVGLLLWSASTSVGCVRDPARLPAQPVVTCDLLSRQQLIALAQLSRRVLPTFNTVLPGQCRHQCGLIVYAGLTDPQDVVPQVLESIDGWPVCVQPG